MSRLDLGALDGKRFDVVVIGAGINGASAAQHLVAAGHEVLLVDKADYGAGSSARSTRMLHCGLRYFETPRPVRDFLFAPRKLAAALRMAKAAMAVRGELVKDSPERLRRIRILFPLWRDGPYRGWHFDLAFRVLGGFGPRDVGLDYELIPPERCAALPFIASLRDRSALRGVAAFTEYMFRWPERVCLDAVLDAQRMGGVVRNYTHAQIGEVDSAGLREVLLRDTRSGAGHARVRAPIVLNMGGIWIDAINAAAGSAGRRLVFGTKGAHLVVKLPAAWRDHGIAATNSLGEPHYILPSEGGYHHIGPTETAFEGDIDDVRVSATERDFLLEETRALFPDLGLSAADVVYAWAGVRPLGRDSDYPKGKRVLELHDLGGHGLSGVYALTAGPIMTHRIAAREVVDRLRPLITPSRCAAAICYSPRATPPRDNSALLRDGDDATALSAITYAVTHEHAVTLVDALLARTGVGYAHRLEDAELRRAAQAMAVHLRWSREDVERQVRDAREHFQHVFQVEETCGKS